MNIVVLAGAYKHKMLENMFVAGVLLAPMRTSTRRGLIKFPRKRQGDFFLVPDRMVTTPLPLQCRSLKQTAGGGARTHTALPRFIGISHLESMQENA